MQTNGYYSLMWNNINEKCSVVYNGSLYLLHPPDRCFNKKAIASLVDYFSPDMEEEKEEKPAWASQYELDGLGLQEIANKINKVDRDIKELAIQRNILLPVKKHRVN